MDETTPRALITGAARRLGRTIARAFADAGYDIVVHYRTSEEEARSLVDALASTGRRGWTIQADLADPKQADALIDCARDACGSPLSVLVNNASVFRPSTVETVTAAQIEENVRLHAYAPLALSRAFAAQANAAALPCIVNLTDCRVADTDRAHLAYHLSKRMLHDLTKLLALELAPAVRVNAVAPGLILPPPGESEAYLEKRKDTNPLQQTGSPEEIADAVLYLVRARFVTGQTLYVDGGRHLKGQAHA